MLLREVLAPLQGRSWKSRNQISDWQIPFLGRGGMRGEMRKTLLGSLQCQVRAVGEDEGSKHGVCPGWSCCKSRSKTKKAKRVHCGEEYPSKSAHELERTANSWILSGFEDSSKALEWIGRLLSILNRRVIKSTGVSLDSAGHGSRLSLWGSPRRLVTGVRLEENRWLSFVPLNVNVNKQAVI